MKKATVFSLLLMVFVLASFTVFQTKPWPVPDKAAKTANPVKSDASSIAAGKALWSQHCASCHGKAGAGDGPKSEQLETPLIDFSKAAFQSQSDGSVYFKTAEGRGDMPSFKKKITDSDDIWALVNFMRSLKK